MKRRQAILGIVLLAVASPAIAQQTGKIARVGVLHAGSSKESPAIQREPFERGLREHGWTAGSNLVIDYRYAEGNSARLDELAAALVRAGMDVIVARGPNAISAARRATAKIPIVMSAGTDDPVAAGWVKTLSQPGGNVTGVLTLLWELDKKRLELLKEAFPDVRRVAVLTNPDFDPGRYATHVATLHDSARGLKLQLDIVEVRRPDQIAAAFAGAVHAGAQALLVQGDPLVLDHNRSAIVAMAAKHKLPAVYPWPFFAEAGGLMSYGASFSAFHHRAATYVSRILRGARAGDLPIEQPSQYELVVNMGAAKAQGLTIPQSVLFRADHLIP